MTKLIHIQKQLSLAPLTTLKIGGPARFFARAETEQQVIEAFNFAKENQLELFVLGGGSNILVSDEGFDGLVLQIALCSSSGFKVQSSRLDTDFDPKLETLNSQLFTVGAGENWDEFVDFCVEKNLAGIECLSGIPGFVGGTPVQNVGAYGQEVSETIVTVRCLDRSTGEVVELTNAECGFAYRTSIFNTSMRDRYIVLSVTYALTPGGEPLIIYKDLKNYFAEIAGAGRARGSRQDTGVTLKEARNAVLRIRRSKSMVIDADDPNSRSAGSFFKNPIVKKEKISEICAKMQTYSVPHFRVDENLVKIPAAWLIENAGFQKGHTKGNVGLSTKHTLAIVNRGNASAKEIVSFMNEIQSKVKEDFGIELKPEPVFIGF